jgi:hypothetical protein
MIMKIPQKQHLTRHVIRAGLVLACIAVNAQAVAANPVCDTCPEDPDSFLTLLERSVQEDAVSARAYYDAVDPDDNKTTIADWYVEAGFIDDPSDYTSSGRMPLNPGSKVVVHQNVADLGFVRRVSTRCEPRCSHPNPDVYSVIENYKFLAKSDDPFRDAARRKNRLASVAMELTAAADGSNPSRKFITYYAFTGTTANDLPPFRDSRDQADGIPFAPDLDGRGKKQVPGLCSSCHGGAPRVLNTDGPIPNYPENGDTGAHFLPLDLDNFVFDKVRPGRTREKQELRYRKTNKMVLIDHRGTATFDEVAGIDRLPAVQELIEGWYGGPGLPNDTFNGEFVPVGWLPPAAPDSVGELYLEAIAPACRSCHANQKRALDFATYEGFMVFEDAHIELVLRIECGLDDDSGIRLDGADDQAVMPLALVTYEKFWESDEVEVFKDHLGEINCNNL